jgi:Holliday junction resolvase RusA-like endonuclease
MITSRLIFDHHVVGEPKGQPRPQAFVRKGKGGAPGKAGVYDPKTADGWKGLVVLACKDGLEGRLLAAPLMVSLTFYFTRPAGHLGKRGLRPSAPRAIHRQKPDTDNAAKAVLDALTVIQAWQDDAQISDLIIRKRWVAPGTAAGCRIQIHELTETLQ